MMKKTMTTLFLALMFTCTCVNAAKPVDEAREKRKKEFLTGSVFKKNVQKHGKVAPSPGAKTIKNE